MSEEQALDVALAAAAAAGASDAQVTAVRAREVRLRRRRGRMEESTEATTRSASLDVWVDGRFGSATTTDLRPGTLADFVRRLVELTRELEPDPDRRIADPSLFPAGEAPPLDLVDPALAILDREGREAMLVELAEPLEGVPDTLSSTASVSTAHTLRLHGTSNGLRTSWEETQVGVFVTATVPDRGDRRSEDRAWATCRHLGDLPELGSLGREALRRARARVGSSVGATRRATVVVEPRAAGHLLRWLLTGTDGHALHAGHGEDLLRADSEREVAALLSHRDRRRQRHQHSHIANQTQAHRPLSSKKRFRPTTSRRGCRARSPPRMECASCCLKVRPHPSPIRRAPYQTVCPARSKRRQPEMHRPG